MPRDGSGIYTRPPGTNAVADTTIESTKYNANVADVEADLNAPRPIIAGGTGANNAVDAANNLGVVTGKGAQTFTEAEKAVARSNIAAAPFDALAYNGMQINGSMEVDQIGNTPSTTNGSVCDGYYISGNYLANIGAVRINNPGYLAQIGTRYYFHCQVNTAVTTVGATDNMFFIQKIEGYRIARLCWGTPNAQSITVNFWTMHQVPGTYGISVQGGGAGPRAYTATYQHVNPGAAEFHSITVPGDTGGTWSDNNLTGIQLSFPILMGSSFTAPVANTWATGNYIAPPGQTNGMATTGHVFRLGAISVIPGTQAPTAAQSPLIMRPYDQELLTCKRYFQKYFDHPMGWAYAPNIPTGVIKFDPEMRVVPTLLDAFWIVTSGLAGVVSIGSNLVTTGYHLYNSSNNWTLNTQINLRANFDARL